MARVDKFWPASTAFNDRAALIGTTPRGASGLGALIPRRRVCTGIPAWLVQIRNRWLDAR